MWPTYLRAGANAMAGMGRRSTGRTDDNRTVQPGSLNVSALSRKPGQDDGMTDTPAGPLWLFTDGGARKSGNSSNGPAAAAYIIKDGHGRILAKGAKPIGVATNNEAEYWALIFGLRAAQTYGTGELRWASDAELVVNHMMGEYRVRAAHLRTLYARAKKAAEHFTRFLPEHRSREDPEIAAVDKLYNEVLDAYDAAGP